MVGAQNVNVEMDAGRGAEVAFRPTIEPTSAPRWRRPGGRRNAVVMKSCSVTVFSPSLAAQLVECKTVHML